MHIHYPLQDTLYWYVGDRSSSAVQGDLPHKYGLLVEMCANACMLTCLTGDVLYGFYKVNRLTSGIKTLALRILK